MLLPLLCLFLVAGIAQAATGATTGSASAADVQSRGQAILRRLVEANRYWLLGAPPSVKSFSYELNRISGRQEFEITDPAKASRPRLRGVTYYALLQQLASKPGSATVTEIVEEGGKVRLALKLDPGLRGAIGNGVENSWNGYHSLGGNAGYVVLDTERWVPLEAQVGRLTETFGEYAQVDPGHYVPLAVREQMDDTQYNWRFRLYAPGLWLFDDSTCDGRRLAWVEQVKINAAEAVLRQATAGSLEQAQKNKVGQERLETFLKANRHWLLPSLQARRSLVYEYRQEAPYVERVLMDVQGNLMVRLEATKESPDRPTRQRLWLADGRSYSGDSADAFIKLEGTGDKQEFPEAWLRRDRIVQHLAMGLALDCALTRLAREPEMFWAEVRSVPTVDDRYVLVLHPKGNAALFTGTMLTFSSWAFMHDVRYERSEIICDAATHHPLEERDYAGQKELKGEHRFDDWLSDASGAAPGRIRAVMPYEKDGKDQALEMDAKFRFARPGVWLLDRVESHFRSGGGGSTGTVTLISTTTDSFLPIQNLIQKAETTAKVLGAIQEAPTGSTLQPLTPGEWTAFPLRAAWTDKARESAQTSDERRRNATPTEPPLIGLQRARLVQPASGPVQVEFEGLSTASWKEFRTEWKVRLENAQGQVLASSATNVDLRAESAPAPFLIRLDLSATALPAQPPQLAVEATVQRMTGAYHGHGMWFRFTRED